MFDFTPFPRRARFLMERRAWLYGYNTRVQMTEKTALAVKISLFVVAIALLGLAPRPLATARGLERARQSLETGDPRGAAAWLGLAAARQPWRSDLWAQAGRAAYAGGDARAAVGYLGRAAPLGVSDLLLLGDAFARGGNVQQAIDTWEGARQRYGESPAVYSRLLQAQSARGDYAAATATLQTLLRLSPSDARSTYRLGLLLAANQPEQAIAYLVQAAALDPAVSAAAQKLQFSIETARVVDEPAYTFTSVGQVLASMDEWILAAQAFDHATQARPDYADAWAFLGEARQHIGADGFPALQTAIHLAPASLSANALLGLYYERQAQYDLAIPYISQTIQLQPDNPVWQVELGNIRAAQGDLQSALAAYQQATLLSPKEFLYWRLLAEFCLQRQIQIRTVALPAARQAVLLNPADAQNLDAMGQALLSLQDAYNAERFLQRALQIQADYAPAYLHLGELYLFQGDRERAHRSLQQALALRPDPATATQARRLLEQHFP